jgi:hypothetical protein
VTEGGRCIDAEVGPPTGSWVIALHREDGRVIVTEVCNDQRDASQGKPVCEARAASFNRAREETGLFSAYVVAWQEAE